jgi:hypothetical protein
VITAVPSEQVQETDPPAHFAAARRVVVGRLAVAAVGLTLAALAWRLELRALPLWLLALAAVQLLWFADAVVARVDLGPDGVTVRRLLGTVAVDRPRVHRFLVMQTPFGRHVVLRSGGRRPIRLAGTSARWLPDPGFDQNVEAIRDWCARAGAEASAPAAVAGWAPRRAYYLFMILSLALAIWFDRPAGWFAGVEARALPDPCSVAAGSGTPSGPPLERACAWDLGNGRTLTVTYRMYPRAGLRSGTSAATTAFPPSWQPTLFSSLPVTGHIGDESVAGYLHPRNAPNAAVVLRARRANVIVDVYLGPPGEQGIFGAYTPVGASEFDRVRTVSASALDAVVVR